MSGLAFNRILLKLSGEALAGKSGTGIDPHTISSFAQEIVEIRELGVQVGIVVGGGNIFRGKVASEAGMDRVASDYMGMLATIINALALQDMIEKKDVETRVMTAINMEQIAEPYIRRRAIHHLEKNLIIVLAGGTGNPYFTTDTAAALRAIEIEADVILKATKVNGVYDSDPVLNKNAKMYDKLSYMEVLNRDLRVMDATSIALCKENEIPLVVFNIRKKGNIKRIVRGETVGTIIS